MTYDGTRGGLSPDGTTLVLAPAPKGGGLAAESRLLVLDAKTLRTRRTVVLPGDFSFDALSPDGRTLFLIQHTSAVDFQRYRVRAYDLVHGRLRPQAIIDKTEPNMSGYPVLRLTGPGAASVYTLYAHQGGEPFVHALDTVHARARCLDVEWHGNQELLWTSRLALRDEGRRLVLLSKQGHELAGLTLSQTRSGSSMAVWAAGGASLLALAASAFLLRRRRRSRPRRV